MHGRGTAEADRGRGPGQEDRPEADTRHPPAHQALPHGRIQQRGSAWIGRPYPMRDVKVPAGERSGETHAYTLEEVIAILEAIPEPTKTVIATASFTGLRMSELRGLRWGDFRDGQLFVTRTVWRTKTEERTKTTASRAGVPVLPVLAKYLDAHRNGQAEDGLLFAGPKMSFRSTSRTSHEGRLSRSCEKRTSPGTAGTRSDGG